MTLEINTQYMRITPPSTTPNPIGGENNPEAGKCNNLKLRNNEGRDENPEGKVTHISVSYTVGDYKAALNNFLEGEVGTHYLIQQDGKIDQLVDEKYAPYAVGNGEIIGKLNPNNIVPANILNNYVISAHLENDGKTSYPDDQIKAFAHLLEGIVERNQDKGLNEKFVIAFADYAPERHVAPGPYFPWKDLANAKTLYDTKSNFGVYSFAERKENPKIIVDKEHHDKEDVEKIQTKLEEYGIKVLTADKSNLGVWDLQTQRGVLAFNLHHQGEEIVANPEKLKAWEALWKNSTDKAALDALDALSTVDENTYTILDDLISQFDVPVIG